MDDQLDFIEQIQFDCTDSDKILLFWGKKYSDCLRQMTQSQYDNSTENDGRNLVLCPELYEAACSLGKCNRLLDYGCGTGWAGILAAINGCSAVTCADVVIQSARIVTLLASRYRVGHIVRARCIQKTWLSEVPSDDFDSFCCFNVLDVVPPEMAEDIVRNINRVVEKDGRIVVSLNSYYDPEMIRLQGNECRTGNCLYENGVLRLVNRNDDAWIELFSPYFRIERWDYFAWPPTEARKRRLIFLRNKK